MHGKATQASSRALFGLSAVVGLGFGRLPGCPDPDANERSWPVWPTPNFKLGALAGIEQGARVDEARGASTLQTWRPQYAEAEDFELGGPAEIFGFSRPEGDALAVQEERMPVIEYERCAWEGVLGGIRWRRGRWFGICLGILRLVFRTR